MIIFNFLKYKEMTYFKLEVGVKNSSTTSTQFIDLWSNLILWTLGLGTFIEVVMKILLPLLFS